MLPWCSGNRMTLKFTERHTSHTALSFEVKEVLFWERSEYQDIQVIFTPDWGKILILDGLVMLTEKDEFIYHEMIVHPPLLTHPSPREVLVIGGGDGGAAREILRHPEVENIEVCEIDEKVIEVSRKFFPQVAKSFSDSRVKINIRGGAGYLQEKREDFDVIIVDSTDPSALSDELFTQDFYKNLHKALREDGLGVLQSQSIMLTPGWVKKIFTGLRKVFPGVWLYLAPIPTYPGGIWSFTLVSKKYSPLEDFSLPRWEKISSQLRYFNPSIHRASFDLPGFVKKILEE